MAYLLLILYITSIAIAAFVGWRLGRHGSASTEDGSSGESAGRAVADSLATTEQINAAVADAIRTNDKIGDTIQKMREILNRNVSSSSDQHGIVDVADEKVE